MNKSHTTIPNGRIEKSSFSSNWKEYSVKDFCDITSSKRIFYREYVKSGIPFYRSKEIIAKSNGKELNDCLYISKDRFEEIKNKYGIPINGDILITAVGTYGIPYLINEDGDFYFKDGNLIWLKNIKDVADSNFLFYWFKSEEAKNKVEGIIIGSVQKALTIDAMKNIKINLPPLAEQKRIASILSAHLAIMRAGIFFQIGLSIFAYSSNKATADIPLFAPFLYTITLEALGFFFSSHTSFQTPSSRTKKSPLLQILLFSVLLFDNRLLIVKLVCVVYPIFSHNKILHIFVSIQGLTVFVDNID